MNREDDGTFTDLIGPDGYVKLITRWGSDQGIVEAARMSVDKGFEGWGDGVVRCTHCFTRQDGSHEDNLRITPFLLGRMEQCQAGGHLFKATTGDEKLLAHLRRHHHTTPFEMAGMQIEVDAPIFVFREWHRHRTQSYNEMSGRYIQLPDRQYTPSTARLMMVNAAGGNKQAQGVKGAHVLTEETAAIAQEAIRKTHAASRQVYEELLTLGVSKECARVILPVGQYSRMRAQANLWNWLHFLGLRTAPDAQWEIRMYSQAVATLIGEHFPRAYALWSGTAS